MVHQKIKLTVFSCMAFVAAKAQPNNNQHQLLDTVVITAQRQLQSEKKVPATVSTISRNYINRYQPRTTPEALMAVNGVWLQKTNHGGGAPFVRGLTGNQTLLLIDGIRLNNSTFRYGPNQYLNTIDAFSIEKIEVANGTGSVQYGSDALGGVIHIFNITPAFSNSGGKWTLNSMAKYMSGDMEKTLHNNIQFSTNKTAFTSGLTVRNFGAIIGGDTTGKQIPSGYTEWSANMKWGFKLNQQTTLLIASQALQQKGVPVYHKVLLENFAVNEMDPQLRTLNYARISSSTRHTWLQTLEITLSHQHTKEGRNSQKNNSNTFRREEDKVNTLGLQATVNSRFAKNWMAQSGIELYHDKVYSLRKDIVNSSITYKRGLYPNASKYGNYSFYSLHHLSFNKLTLTGGVRYNSFTILVNDTTLGNVKLTPAALVVNAGINYQLHPKHFIYAAYNSGYRAPNIDDMGTLGIVDFRYELPTTHLSPEKTESYEIGYKLRAQQIVGSVSFFYMKLSNLIARIRKGTEVINGYPVYTKENIENAFIRGAEACLQWQPLPNWHFNGAVAYTYGQNLTRKEPLRRMPPLNSRLTARYQKKKLNIAVEGLLAAKQTRLAQGDKEDNRIPVGGTPGWNIMNLYAGYEWKRVHLQSGLQNIFNIDYRTHGSGINGYGRSIWLTINLFIN
ncbi:MAG: hypothetical protein RLZZ316_1231 [Bacteroidota bacterium]